MSGGIITDGYHASGTLTGVNGTTATSQVADTNDPNWLPTGALTMTLDVATDSISTGRINYCGPKAPSHVCY
jgi:hypothetical protein